MTSSGTGGPICGYCGRPMLAGVSVGGMMYHEECTRGPGYQRPVYQPTEPSPWRQYVLPTLTEDDVRRVVREELAAERANGG